jgi:uncharacterized membrane-anchored protein YjiN (DUF445 family)
MLLKKNNHYKATLILILATLGFIMSYPFNYSFWGKIISSGFSAAMIGGIADWFGVTALFRKPLGISFRTEIIPRNRDKLFDSLVYMVENELLTKETLKKKIREIDLSDKLIHYMENYGGKNDIEAILTRVLHDILSKTSPEEIGTYMDKLINETLPGIKLAPIITDALEWTVKNNYDENIVSFIANEVAELLKNRQTSDLISEVTTGLLEKIKTNSEKESTGKKIIFSLFFTFMSISNLSAERMAEKARNELLAYVVSLKDSDSENRHRLMKYIQQGIGHLKSNDNLQTYIEDSALSILKQINLTPFALQYIYEFGGEQQQSAVNSAKLHNLVEGFIDKAVTIFKQSEEQQRDVDKYIKEFLINLIDEKHSEIGRLVRQKLDGFSNDALVEVLEEKAGNDLQMIRINGSIVGGIAGMVIAVFSHLAF